jgi:hypothetical protein
VCQKKGRGIFVTFLKRFAFGMRRVLARHKSFSQLFSLGYPHASEPYINNYCIEAMTLTLLTRDSIQDLTSLASQKSDHPDEEWPTKEHTHTSPEKVGPNPQQAQEEDSMNSSLYAGFRSDYQALAVSEDSYYYQDNYSYYNQDTKTDTCWTCLFPWMKKTTLPQSESIYENDVQEQQHQSNMSDDGSSTRSLPTAADDEISTTSINSDILGERLSTRERQAVMARLRLTDPSALSLQDTPIKGLLNLDYDQTIITPVPLKGILKRSLKKDSLEEKAKETIRRRSLFPQYESTTSKTKGHLHVKFAPMARVVTLKSKHDMVPEEKSDVWWQKSDYEDFRKTGRIITKAMLEGGSELWLSKTTKRETKVPDKNDTVNETGDHVSSAGDKWWHRFGHTRRGLEHVVSFDEGRQRQLNVRTAIQSVLEEQARQKRYSREDPEKLRIVSLNHTTWARDLSLAAGASDADAVKSSFAGDRKSREFYLLKLARQGPTHTHRRVPEFMQPGGRSTQLDAHTASQINFRRDSFIKPKKFSGDIPPVLPRSGSAQSSSCTSESSEPIRDPDPDEPKSRESMSQRAKGYSSEGGEKMDMAAVLSGMGAVAHLTNSPAAVKVSS